MRIQTRGKVMSNYKNGTFISQNVYDKEMLDIYSRADDRFILWGSVHRDMLAHMNISLPTLRTGITLVNSRYRSRLRAKKKGLIQKIKPFNIDLCRKSCKDFTDQI